MGKDQNLTLLTPFYPIVHTHVKAPNSWKYETERGKMECGGKDSPPNFNLPNPRKEEITGRDRPSLCYAGTTLRPTACGADAPTAPLRSPLPRHLPRPASDAQRPLAVLPPHASPSCLWRCRPSVWNGPPHLSIVTCQMPTHLCMRQIQDPT